MIPPGNDLDRLQQVELLRLLRARMADAMRREANANMYKGGWRGRSARRHRRDLDYHVAKLHAAVAGGRPPQRVIEYAADVCNHALFMADDALRGWFDDAVASRQREPAYVFPGRAFYVRLVVVSPSTLLRPGSWRKLWTAIARGRADYEGEKPRSIP